MFRIIGRAKWNLFLFCDCVQLWCEVILTFKASKAKLHFESTKFQKNLPTDADKWIVAFSLSVHFRNREKSSVFQCSFYQNFNFTAVKISFLKQFRELTNDTMMWDNINWQCRWNQTCEEAIWCMETIPVIRRLQPRKFHESHLQSILPAEALTSSTTAAMAPTSCTTAAVAPTSCTTPAVAPTSSTTPPEALTSSTKPPEAVSPCIAAGHDDAKPDGEPFSAAS